MVNNNPNTEGLLKYAREKGQQKRLLVEDVVKKMIKQQKTININSVSIEAGVSKRFLYETKDLFERIDTLRKQQKGLPAKQVRRNTSDESKDVIIASLRNRIKKLEEELIQTKKVRDNLLLNSYDQI
ncbi:DUF6262 family protein [Brevibacillus porteri]|uniref:Transposase n=1 Tax=Brevibacillus porteri TaxID=2126350 RepID=A0ABX5FFL2_9BACL|nr:DUF6262 family protein [Brevibacillus porteri]MED1802835.1 DUF6262 family protein [Brevibacillus porteri]MED2133305.1 DUF6262 family protein [Brevibacillus porteri]MED2748780.1 DUF6262 family protein [Brevibacillus porteri]MED2812532.1 DUF6262 family protein [Brevibacillus porteri]MED2895571.1 DUF6262 family protein [Brevibacillus porteri]